MNFLIIFNCILNVIIIYLLSKYFKKYIKEDIKFMKKKFIKPKDIGELCSNTQEITMGKELLAGNARKKQ